MAALKKMAILRVTAQALRELLQLPVGAEVLRVEVPHGQRGGLEVVVEGVGWDTPEGGPIVPTFGTCTVQKDAEGNLVRYTIDWRFPAEPQSDYRPPYADEGDGIRKPQDPMGLRDFSKSPLGGY